MGLGVLLGLGASACWAFANVYIQRASRQVGAMRALLWSQLVGLVGLAAIIAAGGDPRGAAVRSVDFAWLAVGGLASLGGYVGVFHGFARAPLSVAVPIMSSWSLISALVAIAIFGEHLRPLQAVGGTLIVLGVLVVARFATAGGHAASEQPAQGGQAAPSSFASASPARAPVRVWLPSVFAGALGFGGLIPIVDHLAPAWGRLGAIAGVFLADLVLGLPIALVLRGPLGPPSRGELGVVVAAGFFETLGFVCISIAGRHAPVAIVSPLASLSSAFTLLFAWVWLRERPASQVLLGAALACAGVLTLAF